MSAARGQGNTLWLAIAVAVVLVGLTVLVATKVRLPKPIILQPPDSSASSVTIIRANGKGGNAAVQQLVELFDPKPLFLPTPINNSDPGLPTSLRREPGAAFPSFPSRYFFNEYDMKKIAFPEPITVPRDPVEVLRTGETVNPFFTFGRINYLYTPVPARQAFLEVLQAKTGKTVMAVPLAPQKPSGLPNVDWQPLEMMLAIESTGMVGEPTVTSGSGFEEVDDYFRAFIAKQFRLGARLPPGFYTLRIGP